MNNSPFELFRRNLKPLMVFLTLLALFAFVVLPVVQSSMQRGAGAGGDAPVAKYGGTTLTRNRVDYFTRNHQSILRFLNELALETISRGGVPQTAGFEYDQRTKQIRSLGINQNPSIEGTIRTFMFASEANKAGFELDDSSLQVWLEQFTDGMISNSDINAMLMKSTQNQMGRPHLNEQLRNHLLADVYLRRGNATLVANDGGALLTPAEQWSNFLKLNQKAVVDSYAVLASDYLDQTNTTPGEAEIRDVYEQGKDRNPSDQSVDPGFHRRYTASFGYLVGDYQIFLDQEIAKLSEQQLRDEYARRIKGGDFQLPESAALDVIDDNQQAANKPSGGATESTAEPDSAAEEMNQESAQTEPSDPETKAASKEQDGGAKTDDQPNQDKDDKDTAKKKGNRKKADKETSKPPEDETQQSTSDSADSNPGDEQQPADDDQSQRARQAVVRLVAFQPPDAADSPPQEQENAAADTNPTADDDSKPTSKSNDDATDQESDAKKDDSDSATETGEPEKPKFESFEEVRDQIAEDLAGPTARKRLDSAITEVTTEMRNYFNRLSIHQSNVSIGQGGDPPVMPDLDKLAEKLGLQHENIGPHSEATISDEPISNSHEVGSQFGRRGPPFAVMMFGFDNGQTQLPPQPLFAPLRTADDPEGKIYVTWKTAETEAYTPSLDEVRDEVVMAIRMSEARKLARQAAEDVVKQAAASDKSVNELVPEDKRDNVKDALGPFSWMNSFGFSGATIGNVPELDSVGEEFMRTVFSTKLNESGVALNQSGRVVYVVTPTRLEPPIVELRQQFKQPVNRMMARMVAGDATDIVRGFYQAADEQAGFESYLETE